MRCEKTVIPKVDKWLNTYIHPSHLCRFVDYMIYQRIRSIWFSELLLQRILHYTGLQFYHSKLRSRLPFLQMLVIFLLCTRFYSYESGHAKEPPGATTRNICPAQWANLKMKSSGSKWSLLTRISYKDCIRKTSTKILNQ